MTTEDILQLRNRGEVSKVQFKERILDKYDIGCELVAMSNFRGGQLVIGINDKTGEFNPLSYAEVQETTNMLGNIASFICFNHARVIHIKVFCLFFCTWQTKFGHLLHHV